MKLTYVKGSLIIKFYENYKTYYNDFFSSWLRKWLKKSHWLKILHYHAPIKRKVSQVIENFFMSKALHKAITMRSGMKNWYLKNKTDLNCSNYKKHRKFCTNLLRKTKKEYFSKLGIIKISNIKIFWKTMKKFFSAKVWIVTKWCLVKTIK